LVFANYWFGWSGTLSNRRSKLVWSSFPGSSWASVGTQAATERRNVVAIAFVEQGVTLLQLGRVAVVPFAEQTVATDSRRYFWNNRHAVGEGLKVRLPFRGGVIEAAGMFKHERRWLTDEFRSGPTGSVTFWYGWEPSTGARN
jgi:hypothetical protein